MITHSFCRAPVAGRTPGGCSCPSPEDKRLEVPKEFYSVLYATFVSYGVYKGRLNGAATVIETFLQKKKRTPAALRGAWRAIDYRCKVHEAYFSIMPDVQWETASKLRVALWDKADVVPFILKAAPHLLSSGFSMSDERTGTWIDEREVMSVHSGSSAYSTASLVTATGELEPIVLVDVPDHLLKPDVKSLVRQALVAKGTVQGVGNIPLQVKRLDWTMGNACLPCWQVASPVGLSAPLVGSMLDIDVPDPFGGVQQALVYSVKDYMSAHAA